MYNQSEFRYTISKYLDQVHKKFQWFWEGNNIMVWKEYVEQTFLNYKIHFKQENQTINRVRTIIMRNTVYHEQVNAITSVLLDIKSRAFADYNRGEGIWR